MKWFHKRDGGPIKFYPNMNLAYCPVCDTIWQYLDFWWRAGDSKAAHNYNWVSFNELPEDLQSMALAEML